MPSNFDESGAQFAWDSTTLKSAYACQRQYYFQFIEHFTSPQAKVDLVFGGHYAKALERYHKLIALGSSHDDATVSVVRDVMIETWEHNLDKEGNPIPGTGYAVPFLHSSKTRENLIRTIIWYLEEHKVTSDAGIVTLIDGSGNPVVERSFVVEFSDELVYCGHLDRGVSYSGHNFIQDQKTSGSTISPSYFEKFDLDIQMSGYTFVGKMIFDKPIHGVMIDAAQIAVGFSAFRRGFTMRTPEQLTEWYDTTLSVIHDVREATKRWRDTGDVAAFRPNFTACSMYNGCPFAGICNKPASLRQQFLTSNFERRRPWNPLESR